MTIPDAPRVPDTQAFVLTSVPSEQRCNVKVLRNIYSPHQSALHVLTGTAGVCCRNCAEADLYSGTEASHAPALRHACWSSCRDPNSAIDMCCPKAEIRILSLEHAWWTSRGRIYAEWSENNRLGLDRKSSSCFPHDRFRHKPVATNSTDRQLSQHSRIVFVSVERFSPRELTVPHRFPVSRPLQCNSAPGTELFSHPWMKTSKGSAAVSALSSFRSIINTPAS